MFQEIQSPDHSDEELNYQQFMDLNRDTKGKRNKPKRSSKEVQGLKQEAMRLFINGDLRDCKDKLMDIITLDPKNHELYFMMGEIYEEDTDKKKAAHYYSLSAELSAPDPRKWEKIGDLYQDVHFYQQAAYCYGRCLKSEPINLEVLRKRALAYERNGEHKKAVFMYYKILRINPSLNTIKDCAKLHCKLLQYDKAREVLAKATPADENIVYMICETYMKEGKYQEALEEIQRNVLMGGTVAVSNVMIEFIKMLLISALHLHHPDTEQHFTAFLSNLNQDNIDLFESVLDDPAVTNNTQIGIRILEAMVCHKQIVKKPEYYLGLADLYHKGNFVNRDRQILERGEEIFGDNRAIKDQLSLLRIKASSGKQAMWEPPQIESEEEIFISDMSQNEEPIKASQVVKKIPTPKPPRKKPRKQSETFIEDEGLVSIQKSICNLYQLVELKREQPQVLIELFPHLQGLLRDVSSFMSQLKMESYNDIDHEEKRGLFSRKAVKRKRRSRPEHKINFSEQKLMWIISTWIDLVSPLSCWNKLFQLSSLISRLGFLKRFPKEKQRIYQVCVVACLQLKRYRRALFLLKYLLHQDSENMVYLLLCNILVRKINSPNTCKFILSKLSQYVGKYPSLSYLIAFEHLESGYFQHSIRSLLKIPLNQNNREGIYLCLASCFVQLASSRNTTDKLSMVNRATFMMQQYKAVIQHQDSKCFELLHNLGRFYHQLRITSKAVLYYQQALSVPETPLELRLKTAYSLLCLHKESEDWASYCSLSRQYFTL